MAARPACQWRAFDCAWQKPAAQPTFSVSIFPGSTGLQTSSFEIDPDSVPALPTLKPEEDSLVKAIDASPVVQAAVEHARAQYLRAAGEHRSLWPSVDFAAQYANLADYNNYEAYYKHFQPNNATVGVAIHLPFLNLAQHERVKEAESEARKATTQAEAARNKVSEETLRLQRSVTQMQAARDVAELEYEIAQKDIEATRTRMDSGTANLHDLDDAAGSGQRTPDHLTRCHFRTGTQSGRADARQRRPGTLGPRLQIVSQCLFSSIHCIKPCVRRRTCINTGFSIHKPPSDGKIKAHPICLLKPYF